MKLGFSLFFFFQEKLRISKRLVVRLNKRTALVEINGEICPMPISLLKPSKVPLNKDWLCRKFMTGLSPTCHILMIKAIQQVPVVGRYRHGQHFTRFSYYLQHTMFSSWVWLIFLTRTVRLDLGTSKALRCTYY